MLRVWWLAIAVFLPLTLASRAVEAAEPRMPDFSTPERAFETWRAAVVSGDKTAEYRCYNARSREFMVLSLLNSACYFFAIAAEISGDHPIHAINVETQQILKRHKVDLAVFREYENLPKPKGPLMPAAARKWRKPSKNGSLVSIKGLLIVQDCVANCLCVSNVPDRLFKQIANGKNWLQKKNAFSPCGSG